MIETLPLRKRRALAVGILVVLIVFIWTAVIDPIASILNQTIAEKSQTQRLLLAYRQDVDNQTSWHEVYKRVTTSGHADMFIHEKDPNLAAARFQTSIKQFLEEHKALIASIQVLPVTKGENLQRATVRVSFAVPVKFLETLLTSLDHQSPYIFLDNLVISAPAVTDKDTDQTPLSVQCDFFTYLLPTSS